MRVTPAELKVYKRLSVRPTTVKDLAINVYGSAGNNHYKTVQMLLKRLHGKGLVTRSGNGKPEAYTWRVVNPLKVATRLIGEQTDLLTNLFGRNVTRPISDLLKRALAKAKIKPC